MSAQHTVVVGGGLSGLMCGLLLLERGYEDVVIIERAGACGGLLRSMSYQGHGTFDSGTHIFQESLIGDLDRLFAAALADDEWIIHEGNRRDLAGLYYNHRLQINTPFTDLRFLPEADYRACLADFFVNLSCTHEPPRNARQASVSKYGPVTTARAIEPILNKLYRTDPRDLHPFAMNLFTFPLGRVVLFDTDLAEDLTTSAALRARIAYTEQRALPADRASGRRTYYPLKGGTQAVIDGLSAAFTAGGGQIWTETTVLEAARRGAPERITGLRLAGATGDRDIDVRHVYWSAGIPPLARLLGASQPAIRPDKPLSTAVVNLVLDAPLDVADLFYVHCVDEPYLTYRVNAYANYVPRLPDEVGWRVGVELFVADGGLEGAALADRAVAELKDMGFMARSSAALFAKSEKVGQGFPLPTLNNIAIVEHHREFIRQQGLANLTPFGVLSEDGVFFMADVLTDMHRKVTGT